MESKVRKLPKKSIFFICAMILFSICVFTVQAKLKEEKITEILTNLGHKDIKDLFIINKLSVEDTETKAISSVFKVRFYDIDLKKICVGFINKKSENMYSEDFNCKEDK